MKWILLLSSHRFTDYTELEGIHKDPRVQLLSKCPVQGLHPPPWCYQAPCSNELHLWKINRFNYKYPCVLSMNPHITTRTSQHPSCMLLCLRILKPRLPGLVEIFLVEIHRCKLCHFTSWIKSEIRKHLAQICKTDMACRISGCPKMDQGKNELWR